MQKADTPLEFIQKNLNAQEIDPQQVADTVNAERNLPPADRTPSDGQSSTRNVGGSDSGNVAPVDANKVQSPGNQTSDKEPTPSFDFGKETSTDKGQENTQKTTEELDDLPKEASAENFKKLRTSHIEAKKALKAKEETTAALEAKVKAYETGEVIPEVFKAKDEEIQRLKPFEALHNLKASPEFKEKFVKPVEALQGKIKEIFADYGVPAEHLEAVVKKALNTQNKAELNQFLVEYLGGDELGALEAKTLITQAKEIETQARAAEAEPAKHLERIQEESKSLMQVRETQRTSKIADVAQNSWVEALTDIRAKNEILELIPRDNDSEFNNGYVKPILAKAAEEYGRVITELARAGVTEVSKDLAKALANMALLAHSAGVAIQTRNNALAEINELTNNSSRMHTLLRPPLGGGTPSAPSQQQNMNTTPKEDARALIGSILSKPSP